jgi:hypothetical protein
MAELTRDTSFRPVSPVHSHSYVDAEDDANEIFAGAFVQRTATGRVVIVGDSGGLGVGPIVGVNERNVPDQLGKTYSGPLERPTAKAYQGQFERPIDSTTPVTDADMFEPVYAANNHDVTSDPSKPLLGVMVGINNEAQTCTVLVSGSANQALSTSLVLLVDEVIDFGDLTAAALTETLNLGTPIPTGAVPIVQRNTLITPFAHGTATTAVLEVGNDGDDDAYDSGGDIFTGSAFTGLDWYHGGPGGGIGSPAYDGTATGQITATVTIDAGTVDSFTAGSVRVQLWGHVLP